MNMADEAKLRRQIHSTFEALVVWHTIRSCHGEELDPFCRPMLAAGIAVFGASHLFAEHTAQMQCFFQDSESYSGSDQQQTCLVTMTFFWCKFGFGASSHFSHWAGCCRLPYKVHFTLYVTIWVRNGPLLLQRIRENDSSKWQFFCNQLMRHQAFSPFQFVSNAE